MVARKIKTEQEKKKKTKKIVIFVIVFLILSLVIGLFAWKFVFNKPVEKKVVNVKVLDSLDEYGYSLSDKDSKYFKKEYEELKKILNEDKVDEKAYATQVAKLFTIDLYTLSTKINKYDVGGFEYYYDTKKDMFEQKVIDTLYSTLLDDTYGDRKQVLPEVTSVTVVSSEEIKYKLGDSEVNGYLVKLEMTYDSDMGYDNEASVVVCKENGIRWSVVDFQPTLKPKYEK